MLALLSQPAGESNMRTPSIALALVTSMLPPAAFAAAPPANVLFAGTIARQYLEVGGSSWCLFEGTQSTFMRKDQPVSKLISFPDVIIAPFGSVGPTSYTVGGQGLMTFNPNNPNAGRITFIAAAGAPAEVNRPSFNKYKEKYDAASSTLTVSFTIHFPSCELPVSATYRN